MGKVSLDGDKTTTSSSSPNTDKEGTFSLFRLVTYLVI